MKKNDYVICGASHGTNFGDYIFSEMFYELLKQENTRNTITFFNLSRFFKLNLNVKKSNILNLIKSRNLVYISGGYFGQSPNEDFFHSLNRFIRYFLVSWFFMSKRKRIYVIGVGVGPLKYGFLRRGFLKIFEKASCVIVRDDESKNYAEIHGVKRNVDVSVDSALAYKLKSLHTVEQKQILLHLPNVKSEKLIIIADSLKETVLKNQKYSLILANDQISNKDIYTGISHYLQAYNIVIMEYKKPDDMFELIMNSEIIITSKLHVGIIGTLFKKSVFSIPTHPNKTTRYYKQIGYSNRCVPMSEITDEKLRNMFEHYEKKVILSDDLIQKAESNFNILVKNLKED